MPVFSLFLFVGCCVQCCPSAGIKVAPSQFMFENDLSAVIPCRENPDGDKACVELPDAPELHIVQLAAPLLEDSLQRVSPDIDDLWAQLLQHRGKGREIPVKQFFPSVIFEHLGIGKIVLDIVIEGHPLPQADPHRRRKMLPLPEHTMRESAEGRIVLAFDI